MRDFSELSSVNSETEHYNYRSKAAGIDHNEITVNMSLKFVITIDTLYKTWGILLFH